MKPKAKVTYSIRLRPAHLKYLQDRAERESRTVASLVCFIISEAIITNPISITVKKQEK